MPIVQSEFQVKGWLANPHVQTILASKLMTPPRQPTKLERVELDDGDFIDLAHGANLENDIVAIFHGLAGCVESAYVQGAMLTLKQHAFQPTLMHWRGCSGEPNRLRRSYHSGASDDIEWFINHLQKRYKPKRLYALGYSLGANALLKYLGEHGQRTPLTAAIAVSPPLVLQEGANRLNTGFARVYQRYLLGLLRTHHERKRLSFPALDLPKAGSELNSFWLFDNKLTAPLHGYRDVEDYYTRCSARPFLSAIRCPTHIICATDDPFFTPNILPEEGELSQCTTLELSSRGGHVGFLNRNHRWLDQQVVNVFNRFRSLSLNSSP